MTCLKTKFCFSKAKLETAESFQLFIIQSAITDARGLTDITRKRHHLSAVPTTVGKEKGQGNERLDGWEERTEWVEEIFVNNLLFEHKEIVNT